MYIYIYVYLNGKLKVHIFLQIFIVNSVIYQVSISTFLTSLLFNYSVFCTYYSGK